MELAPYLLAAMLSWVDPTTQPEPADVALWRYARLSETIADVVSREPSPLRDDADHRKIGLLLASVASFESFFRADVARCAVMGDHDTSFGAFQLAGRRDLCADVEAQTVEALRLVEHSLHQCRALPIEERLAEYTSGWCHRGRPAARLRYQRAHRYWVANLGEG